MKRIDEGKQKTIVVRVSPELYAEIAKYAEPLVDTFESACWSMIALIAQYKDHTGK